MEPRSFTTWDVLFPSSDQAGKVALSNIMTKFFRLQPEYLGTRRIWVTVYNIPAFITGEVLATFLSTYGRVEEINLLRSAAGTAYRDYVLRMCLTREDFQAIPETIISRERQMMVIVEGRCPCCGSCKQLGHISKFCPQKDPPKAAAATVTAETAATTVSTATISETRTSEKELDHAQPKKVEDWIEVTRKKKKSLKKAEDKSATASPAKNMESASAKVSTPGAFIPKSVTAPIPYHITEHPPATKARKKAKTTPVPTTPKAQETPMEMATNLKKRRSSGEGTTEKMCTEDPLEGPSNLSPKTSSSTSSTAVTIPTSFVITSSTTSSSTTFSSIPHSTTCSPEEQCSQPPQSLQPSQSPQPPQ